MAVVTICTDFGAPQNSLSLFPLFPHLFAMKWWDQMPWSMFSECWVLSQLFHSPLSLSSKGSCFLPLSVVSFACLRLLIFLPAILIPAYASPTLAFLMVYSAFKLNKQGDNIKPWLTPSPRRIPPWNQSVVPCPVLTVVFDLHTDFSGGVRWSRIPISFRIFCSLWWSIQSKALA